MKMKKHVAFIFLLSGCTLMPGEKKETFKLEDYQNFCPSQARLKEKSSKEYIVYKSEARDFYILPGDYILSKNELNRMPQNSRVRSSNGTVKIKTIQDLSDYFKTQAEELSQLANNIGNGVFPTEIKNDYPDRKLAKELVVEKYISTDNPQIVFCGLTLKSEFIHKKVKYKKYIAKEHKDENRNDNIYSGDAGKNYFTLTSYQK